MAFTVAKPTVYSVNTGHAKAPTRLWMCNEGSGPTLVDEGGGSAFDMTLVNAAQWGSDALGAYVTVNSASSYHAVSSTGTVWDASGGLLLIAILQTDSATGPAGAEFWFGTFNSAAAGAECAIRNTTTNEQGRALGTADDASSVGINSTGDIYDQAWHMVAAKFQAGTGTDRCAISIDGAAWDLSASDTLGTTITLDRYAIGARARNFITSEGNGKILAAWSYEAGTYATWDDAWIANLYADPWQFLNTSALTNQQPQFYRRPNTLLRM